MSVQLLHRTAHAIIPGWTIVRAERGGGFVRTTTYPGRLDVQVGDAGLVPPDEDAEPLSVVTAHLQANGAVDVTTATAPPGLLISRDGIRMLPAVVSPRATPMRPADRLLLCSAALLDAPPVGLVRLLNRPAADLMDMAPRRVLETVLSDEVDGGGAAALVIRTPARSTSEIDLRFSAGRGTIPGRR